MRDLPHSPDPTLLARFLAGECTADESAAVNRYLRDNPASAKELEQLATAWRRIDEAVTVGAPPDPDAFWRQLRRRIDVPAAPPVRMVPPRRVWPAAMKVAAAVAV